jgi:serine protease Do
MTFMHNSGLSTKSTLIITFSLMFGTILYFDDVLAKGNPRKPAPKPAQAATGNVLQPSPEFIIITDDTAKQSSLGSAFLVSARHFLTARHVIEDCDAVGIEVEQDKYRAIAGLELVAPQDLALVSYRVPGKPLAIAAALPKPGTPGTHFGFPKDRLAAVQSRFIGQREARSFGRMALRENTMAWAEGARFPEFNHSLGGVSGGPALLPGGQVLGVNIASSNRRGRIYTSDPQVFLRYAKQNGHATPAAAPSLALKADNPLITAQQMVKAGTLRRIYCHVEKAG